MQPLPLRLLSKKLKDAAAQYTMDEGVAILVLWTGRHTNISDRDSKLWDAERCSNPGCPLMCDGPKTFADFIELGKHRF